MSQEVQLILFFGWRVTQCGLINQVLHRTASRPVNILVGNTLQCDGRTPKAHTSLVDLIYKRQFMLFLILRVGRSYAHLPHLCSHVPPHMSGSFRYC